MYHVHVHTPWPLVDPWPFATQTQPALANRLFLVWFQRSPAHSPLPCHPVEQTCSYLVSTVRVRSIVPCGDHYNYEVRTAKYRTSTSTKQMHRQQAKVRQPRNKLSSSQCPSASAEFMYTFLLLTSVHVHA